MSVFKKIYKYFIRSSNESRYLVIKAFFYCATVRFLMLFVKYKRYEKHLGKRGVESTQEISAEQFEMVKKVRNAVLSVSKNTLWESKCMVQALSAKWMLEKYNISSTIYFGIMKDPENASELKAHAWLKVGEYIATGREGHKSFKVVNFYS
jgi:hypothetical protein